MLLFPFLSMFDTYSQLRLHKSCVCANTKRQWHAKSLADHSANDQTCRHHRSGTSSRVLLTFALRQGHTERQCLESWPNKWYFSTILFLVILRFPRILTNSTLKTMIQPNSLIDFSDVMYQLFVGLHLEIISLGGSIGMI